MLFCFVSKQTFHCTSSTEAAGGGDVQGSGVRCTTGVRGACLVELCAKGTFSGAELGTQWSCFYLGLRPWWTRYFRTSVNEARKDLRVGQAQGKSFTTREVGLVCLSGDCCFLDLVKGEDSLGFSQRKGFLCRDQGNDGVQLH